VSRNIPSQHQAVLSVTMIEAGSAYNIIPQSARISGTVRTHQPATRALIEARIRAICDGIGAAMGVAVVLTYDHQVDATVNDPAETDFAAAIATEVAGAGAVETAVEAQMGGEDFSAMLEARPGAFLFLGQGLGPRLHNDRFDFNDAAAPYGASFFARLVETAQPL
jgi:hippurate hydrolase